VRILALLFVCSAAAATGVYWTRRWGLLKTYRGEQVYPMICRWADSTLPKNSIIAGEQMTGAMRYYANRTFARIDWIEPETFPDLRARTESRGYRWYALIIPSETDVLMKNLPGPWQKLAELQGFHLFRLDPVPVRGAMSPGPRR
jgi:hypothetical protein